MTMPEVARRLPEHPPGVVIQDDGVILGRRRTVDFSGAGVTVTDSGEKVEVNVPGGSSLFQGALADLLLNSGTSNNDILGATLTLPTISTYLVVGIFDFEFTSVPTSGADVAAIGVLTDASDVEVDSPRAAILTVPSTTASMTGFRATVAQVWRVTTTTANEVVKLMARRDSTVSVIKVNFPHTSLAAFTAIGGGGSGAGTGLHVDLTDVTAAQHHTRYDDTEAVAAIEAAAALTLGDVEIAAFNLTDPTTLAISGGAVTKTQSQHRIDAESGSSDDLVTVSGGAIGDTLILQSISTATKITVKHNTGGAGQIRLKGGADFLLDSSQDILELLFVATGGGEWVERSRQTQTLAEETTHLHPWQGRINLGTGLQQFEPV